MLGAQQPRSFWEPWLRGHIRWSWPFRLHSLLGQHMGRGVAAGVVSSASCPSPELGLGGCSPPVIMLPRLFP